MRQRRAPKLSLVPTLQRGNAYQQNSLPFTALGQVTNLPLMKKKFPDLDG